VPVNNPKNLATSEVEARRAFLKNCAKFAAATPPAIALLLSVGHAKAHHLTSGSEQCQREPPKHPHCPGESQSSTQQSSTQFAAEGPTDPELADPELTNAELEAQ
jgi:hypothetical protein